MACAPGCSDYHGGDRSGRSPPGTTPITHGNDNAPARTVTVGVDVGGTFTDLIARDADRAGVRIAKVPTTVADRAQGVLAALDAADIDLRQVALIVHGTTATTNAVLERQLSRTGLITTEGFRDVLELGRRTRPRAYGMTGQFVPVIPRDLRLEVAERISADGQVRVPLDEAAVADRVHTLLAAGCESLVVHFLHAYANPEHERRALQICRSLWPNPYVSAGHELLSEAREYERGVTAAVNAGVRPLLESYLASLRSRLHERGYRGELLIMNGNGGTVSSLQVGEQAVKTVMSGPASGVIAAARTGRAAGRADLIGYDMGGTSTDVSLVRGAEPAVSSEIEIEYAMPLHVPMVDVRTVGAGGGSIAWVDDGGLLRVGPASAGADPGPIVYGRGGTRVTLTDANAVLQRLDIGALGDAAAEPAQQRLAAAEQALCRDIGEPLGGLDALTCARAVVRIANAAMAAAIRSVSISLGVDPRDFSLFAFGGAGPLHASALARELGIPSVLVPARPGITNALGCLVADLRHDRVDTLACPLDTLDLPTLHARLAESIEEGRARVASQGVPLQRIEQRLALDMQFIGQTHLLRVVLDGATPSREELQSRFEAAYFARFRVRLPSISAALVNVAVTVIGVRESMALDALLDAGSPGDTVEQACTGRRRVHFEHDSLEVPVLQRERLPPLCTFDGPAIVSQSDTTLLVQPGDRVTRDAIGNLILEVDA